jgi:serine/threonine protein kinase
MSAKAAETLSRRVKDEAELLRIAGEHRSICSYKEIFEGADAWYIVTELARGGELFDRLVERGAYRGGKRARTSQRLLSRPFSTRFG